MTDKEIEQAARVCVKGAVCDKCEFSKLNDACVDIFASYISRNANKIPMIRDLPDYKEDKVPTGVEMLDIIRKALEEHYNIEVMSLSATDNDARLTFAVGELPYSVSFEGG